MKITSVLTSEECKDIQKNITLSDLTQLTPSSIKKNEASGIMIPEKDEASADLDMEEESEMEL